jgi:hypothetical protein
MASAPKTKSVSKCKCVNEINKRLAEDGLKLESALEFDFAKKIAVMGGPFVSVVWSDKPRRGKRKPLIYCAYCPFCGAKSQ